MTGNGHYFVEWKERFVSQERGNRVVHYFLKDSAGESVLAIVGTERSVRHMFYVVAEEFVQAYGGEYSIHAGFKWRSRREVVDWLTSMLSKQHLQADRSKSPKRDFAQALESPEYSLNGLCSRQTQGRLSRNLSGHNSDILWSGVAWTCGKQLKHYPAFRRNGITIAIQSFVFVMAKGDSHYLAYLEDMYEDKRGQKKVKVRWFHHNQEVKGVVPLRNSHPKEVFITHYSQVISAECVDGPAIVLNREHYEECLAAFPEALSTRVHLCFRQFRSNKVKLFDLSKLRGYFEQPILSCLNSKSLTGIDLMGYGRIGEEDEEFSLDDHSRLAKRTRRVGGSEPFAPDHSGMGISVNQMNFEPSYLNCRLGISAKRLLPVKHVASQLRYNPLFKVDEKIEFLCQDSGIRGCWFRCTVLQVSKKQMKIQYDDLQDEDEYGNLEEWIPAFKVAVPDKLGMRFSGRPTIRPLPSPNEQTNIALGIGCAVDAWWSDGWWEGVVIGTDGSNSDILQVYFPGESFFLSMHKRDLRISRDWVGNRWLDIQAKSDILSAISAAIGLGSKISAAAPIVNDSKPDAHAFSCIEVPVISAELCSIEDKKPDEAKLTGANSILEDMDCEAERTPPSSDNKTDEDCGNLSNVCNDNVDKTDGNNDSEVDAEVKDNNDKVDVEVVENSEKKVFENSEEQCKSVELMEVTA